MINERIAYTIASAEMKLQKNPNALKMGPLGDLHLHPELEFILINSGAFIFYTDDSTHHLREGDVFVINARVPHYGEVIAEGSTFCMVQFCLPHEEKEIHSWFWRFLTAENWTEICFPANSPEALLLGSQMERLLFGSYRCHEVLVCHAMTCKYELLGFLYENEYLSDAKEKVLGQQAKDVLRILSFMEAHYSENISLAEIAAQVHMSKNYVCRLFKRVTGRTVMDCLNFLRIAEAEKYLRNGRSVTETSSSVGFSCPAYFGKVFKKYLFFTPTEYRRRITPSDEMM